MDINNNHLVPLDSDHPGFRDKAYRQHRDQIAQAATQFWQARERVESQGGDPQSVPVPRIEYQPREQDTWRVVFDTLHPLHKKNAISSYLDGLHILQITGEKIPQLADVSKHLERTSGFRLVPIEGLVKARTFLTSLLNKEFPSTQYLRHHSKPGFTPEPDLCHEILGHAVLLTRDDITELAVLIGRAAEAASDEQIAELERLYWFTIEYGICEEKGALKTYGAGNLSSFDDMERCVDTSQLEHLPFDLGKIIENDYDPTIQQPRLYVVSSFEHALAEVRDYCTSIYHPGS